MGFQGSRVFGYWWIDGFVLSGLIMEVSRLLTVVVILLGGGIFLSPSGLFAEPISVTDFRGKQITLEKPADRVICLLESALSGLYMLGAEERLVGISTNIYQESVFAYYAAMDERIRSKSLATPGNWDFVNIESVVALQPDLVIIWSGQEESIQSMEEKGIPVYGVFIERFEDIHREIEALGKLTGTEGRAEELVRMVREELDTVRERIVGKEKSGVSGVKKPRVYFMWAQGTLETSGRNSTVQELIELAGGVNVAAGIEQEHLVANLENILVWNPEVIVMWCNDRMDPVDVERLPSWRSVAAIKNGRVREFPDPFSCDFWTLKYLFSVEMVARWCHPERFEKVELESLRSDLLGKLYGGKLGSTLPSLEAEEGVKP